MRRLFHLRVDLVAGTNELRSTSDLAAVDPSAAAAALAKYDDTPERRRLRDTVIPTLGLQWTEVVFLSPVHPHAIWRTWHDLTGRSRGPLEFWSIPASAVPPGAVVLDRFLTATGDPIDPSEVVPFDRSTFRTSLDVPPANRTWLAKLATDGMSGAWFRGIPHVVSPAPVSLSDAEVVDWAVPPQTSV